MLGEVRENLMEVRLCATYKTKSSSHGYTCFNHRSRFGGLLEKAKMLRSIPPIPRLFVTSSPRG
jgi:hypothetical protein